MAGVERAGRFVAVDIDRNFFHAQWLAAMRTAQRIGRFHFDARVREDRGVSRGRSSERRPCGAERFSKAFWREVRSRWRIVGGTIGECRGRRFRDLHAGSMDMGKERRRKPSKSRRRKRQPFDPWRERWPAIDAILEALENGLSLRKSAKMAGVHVATVCRWQAQSAEVEDALQFAAECGRLARWRARLSQPRRKPPVAWHPNCPACGAAVQVRRSDGDMFAFWRCERWPDCSWASWRPRAVDDCPKCGEARYWSCSRKSIGCPGCGRRVWW